MHVVGAMAEFERELLRERTIAGMQAAREAGKRIGRPRVLNDERIGEARRMLSEGRSSASVARVLGVSRSSLYRALAESRVVDDHRS